MLKQDCCTTWIFQIRFYVLLLHFAIRSVRFFDIPLFQFFYIKIIEFEFGSAKLISWVDRLNLSICLRRFKFRQLQALSIKNGSCIFLKHQMEKKWDTRDRRLRSPYSQINDSIQAPQSWAFIIYQLPKVVFCGSKSCLKDVYYKIFNKHIFHIIHILSEKLKIQKDKFPQIRK